MNQEKKISLIGKCDIFKNLSEEELSVIAGGFQPTSFAKGEMVIREGTVGDRFFILVEGEAAILKEMADVLLELKRVGPGECFGEIALITRGERSASVQAVTDIRCLVVTADEFFSILETNPKLAKSLFAFLGELLKESERVTGNYILNAYQSLIFSLSDLTESRDPETASHLLRVRDYCVLIADKLTGHPDLHKQIHPLFCKSIAIASPLHDIGKVAIPDSILLKPGRLTPEEFAIMKSHTWVGANTMLLVMEQCDYPAFEMGYNIIHYHHERYDGTGYPAKLAGDDIPLESRIMALADVYDALLSKRPYKEPFTYDETLHIISEGRGTQFDPDIVDVVLANRVGLEAIHQRCTD